MVKAGTFYSVLRSVIGGKFDEEQVVKPFSLLFSSQTSVIDFALAYQVLIMSATNTSLSYGEIGLSIVTMIANFANFFVLHHKSKATLVYQIQKLDSLVTAVCQIGFLIILVESISETPNASMCTLGTALTEIAAWHFILSNVFMVTGK